MDVYIPSGATNAMILAIQDGVGGMVGAGQSTPGTARTASESVPGGVAPAGGGATPSANPFGSMLPLLIGFIALMLITTMMSGRREKREKKNLMESLGKHDKVQLSGGMIGTITEVKPDEVVVRVDESTKTTIRFVKSAVVRVIKSAGQSDAEKPEKSENGVESQTA